MRRNKMNESKEEMQNFKEEIQKSIKEEIKVLQTILLKNFLKRDIEIQGNHENGGNSCVGTQSTNRSPLSQLGSTNIESHNPNHDFSL